MSIIIAVVSGYLGATVAPWLQRRLKWKAGLLISIIPLALTVYFAAFIPDIVAGETRYLSIPWIPSLGIALSFYLDGLSLLFALLISGIGTLVFIYSSAYLKGHPYQGRFYAFLLVFMASMLGLVLSGNLLSLFVFWELTSISSFLLIGFNHFAEKSRYAALQALLVTSTGGLALMAGIVMLGMVTQSLELPQILTQREDITGSGLYLPILVLVLAGAFTKSAQFPFHFWLPNAMEAPTPVSAYLHSATMVKAGIYLLARLSPVMANTDAWIYTVTGFGALTMFVGAFLALNHWDKKRILAYSTISGLGILTMLLGLGTELAVRAAVAFLVAHALYKGALFLVAGAVEHETGSRNVNVLRGLGKKMPVTALAAIIAGLSLAGIPPVFGFVAKEIFFEAARSAIQAPLIMLLTIISSAALATVAYIVAIRPFFGKLGHTPQHPHEPSPILWLGPLSLAGLGLVLGLAPWLVNGLLSASASVVRGMDVPFDMELWHGFNFDLVLSIITVATGAFIYFLHERLKRAWIKIRRFTMTVSPERLYRNLIDGLLWIAGTQTKILQNGYLRNYLITILVTIIFLVGFTLARNQGYRFLNITGNPTFTEYILAVSMIAAAVTAARLSSLFSAIVAMGIVGYGVALIYVFFGAPDLAMTQLLVETLTVILLILGFYHLPRKAIKLKPISKVGSLLVALTSGALVTILMIVIINLHAPSTVSNYFAENSYILANGRNVVNVILVDFRALDTLGEITVLGVAGIGVFALLKKRPGKDKNQE